MNPSDVFQLFTAKVFHTHSTRPSTEQSQELADKALLHDVEPFIEHDPTVVKWLLDLFPSRKGALDYIRDTFPFAGWVPRYNIRWLLGDLIAGLTVGFVVVPQGMAYALLAGLTPEYGLYTSFTGAITYWIFGTSRDIVIGTTAVGSLLVGSAVASVEEARPGEYAPAEVSTTLSLLSGMILLLIGLLRLGWIVDFIPYISISAFITAAAITIMSTQFPVALGIEGINTRDAPFRVILNTLKGLNRTNLDAAIGLTTVLLLFAVKFLFTYLEGSQPTRKRLWATMNSLRFTFTILLYTLVSYLVHRSMPRGQAKFNIVGTIDAGFKHAGVPQIKPDLVGLVITELPAVMIILIIEHIAIAKSFGRIFSYTVIPSQEIIAQGVANVCSPFVGGYVCTGSFGASAVLSKAGVRTPFAGVFSALVLVLALYALTSVFYYIPNAALAGLIIHATSNLLTPPRSLYRYWQLSPFELLIWVAGLCIALFESLEMSIYLTIGLSLGLLLIRVARTKGSFLGRVRIVLAPIEEPSDDTTSSRDTLPEMQTDDANDPDDDGHLRSKYLPLDRDDGSNTEIKLESPHPGVFVYRFNEGLNYTNQAQHIDRIATHVITLTECGSTEDHSKIPSDRLWNDPGPCAEKIVSSSTDSETISAHSSGSATSLPLFRAMIFDFAAVNNIDVTSVNGLVDLRSTLERHAAPGVVEWHFANVHNRWTKRALAIAGFGSMSRSGHSVEVWSPTYAVAGSVVTAGDGDFLASERTGDEETLSADIPVAVRSEITDTSARDQIGGHSEARTTTLQQVRRRHPINSVDRPFFHLDVNEAVIAAIRGIKGDRAPSRTSV